MRQVRFRSRLLFFLSNRANDSGEKCIAKLRKSMRFKVCAPEDIFTLEICNIQMLCLHTYSAHAINVDMKVHTLPMFTMQKVSISNSFTKNKVNSLITSKQKLASSDDKVSKRIRTKKLVEYQNFKSTLDISCQRMPLRLS